MKKLNSLKIKITVPLLLILTVVFFSSSVLIIDREYNVAKNTLITNAESFAQLSVGTFITNYEIYYESGFLKFSEIIETGMMSNPDIQKIQIIDVNGKILFDTNELIQGKYSETNQNPRTITNQTIINRAIKLSPTTIINESSKHIDIMQPYFNEWGRHDYSIRYFFSLDNLISMQQEMYITLFIYATIFIIISFILILILINRFINTPIKDLLTGVRSMDKGQFEDHVTIRSEDEFGELAKAFNSMQTNLKKTQDSLKEYSENLELLVTKRTEQLEDKTANLVKINKDLQQARTELNTLNQNLEKRIKARTHEVEQLLKQKDEFINQLSHDLKSPLMPMTIMISLLEKHEHDEKYQEYLRVLRRNVEYMKNIAIKTLQLAKLNSPTTQFNLEKTDITQLIKEILSNKTTLFQTKNITIHNQINKTIYVTADKLRIEELLTNLLENAVKFSEKDGSIILEAKKTKNHIEISITDTGIGMTKEQIHHIFDEFYKADESRHDFDSSGLGLAISKKIIERHQGTIQAKSPGIKKGTTIQFTLPLHITS